MKFARSNLEATNKYLRQHLIPVVPPRLGDALDDQALLPKTLLICRRVPPEAMSIELNNNALGRCYGDVKVGVVVVVAGGGHSKQD